MACTKTRLKLALKSMEKLSSTISSQFNAITPIISYDDLIQNGGMSKLLLLDSLIDKNHFKTPFSRYF